MTAEQLLELQLTDSAIDQLRYRIPRLAEVVAAASASADVVSWQQRQTALQNEVAGFEAAIATAEKANEQISIKRTRLETQLKTVIAPREAEALMHEIATLNAQRSALDDQELEAMEGLGQAETVLAEHAAAEGPLRAAASVTGDSATDARATSATELAALMASRDSKREQIDPALLKRYDTMRGQHDGVAIAKLNGLRCEGCHIDMSRGEADNLKRLPADELPECPNCGRLLVL